MSAAAPPPMALAPPGIESSQAPKPGAAILTALHKAMSMARAVPVRACAVMLGL